MSERAIEALREAQQVLAELTGGDTKQSVVNLFARAVEAEMKARAALAAAQRGIKTLNEEAAKGEHCDLDYRPDPEVQKLGELNAVLVCEIEQLRKALEQIRDRANALQNAHSHDECLRQLSCISQLAKAALALSPGKDGITENEHTIARRLKECCERRELPTWAEMQFVADALLARHCSGQFVSPGKVEGWREIESAPKDGSSFLACSGNWMTVCHWHKHQMCWSAVGPVYSAYPCNEQPAYWQPLPSPPISSRAEDSCDQQPTR